MCVGEGAGEGGTSAFADSTAENPTRRQQPATPGTAASLLPPPFSPALVRVSVLHFKFPRAADGPVKFDANAHARLRAPRDNERANRPPSGIDLSSFLV